MRTPDGESGRIPDSSFSHAEFRPQESEDPFLIFLGLDFDCPVVVGFRDNPELLAAWNLVVEPPGLLLLDVVVLLAVQHQNGRGQLTQCGNDGGEAHAETVFGEFRAKPLEDSEDKGGRGSEKQS